MRKLLVHWDGLETDDRICKVMIDPSGLGTSMCGTDTWVHSATDETYSYFRLWSKNSKGVLTDEGRRDKSLVFGVERHESSPVLWTMCHGGRTVAAVETGLVSKSTHISERWAYLDELKEAVSDNATPYIRQIKERSTPDGYYVICWASDLRAGTGEARGAEFPHSCPLCGKPSYNGFLGVDHKGPRGSCTARSI